MIHTNGAIIHRTAENRSFRVKRVDCAKNLVQDTDNGSIFVEFIREKMMSAIYFKLGKVSTKHYFRLP